MVDIHTHIIFGVDDGSKDIDMSVEIISKEYKYGLRDLFCTPHINSISELEDIPKMKENFNLLSERCKNMFPELNIYLGYEVGPSFKIADAIREKKVNLCLGNSRYILIGPFFSQMPDNMSDTLFDLQAAGFIPIIAHPERMDYYNKDPKILEDYIKRDMLFQVNVKSLIGDYGKRIQVFAEKLIDNNWVSFVSTDLHKPSKSSSIESGYEFISNRWNEDLAKKLLIENGKKIIADEDIVCFNWKEWKEPPKKLFKIFNFNRKY